MTKKKVAKKKSFSNPQVTEAQGLVSDLMDYDSQWSGNSWVSKFITDVSDQLDNGRPLTDAQMEKLKEIHEKYTEK